MAKGKIVYFCQSCGNESSKWVGQCPACKEWNTMVEEIVDKKASKTLASMKSTELSMKKINEIESGYESRTTTGMKELDRVLGGGIVRGSLVLVGGDPGIGKSTLLLQVCKNLSDQSKKVLYVSGEESLQQIKIRADRIGKFTDNLILLCETNLDLIQNVVKKEKPDVVIIDSIQTMYNEEVASAPGSVSQVRESTNTLMQMAKGLDITFFVIGHVTKEGTVAGPRVLEHMVDTVLYFEGDRYASYRILRGVKNRFGSTNEIGVFEMRQEGLVEVTNPSEYMLQGKPEGASGSVVVCSVEGSRPILIEVQALVSETAFAMPRRTGTGTDFNRVNLLMAVLEKRARLSMSRFDAYVNIAGGIKMNEPAIDMGIALALISSAYDLAINDKATCFGEIGLSGELRTVSMAEQRVLEAARLGYKTCILPDSLRSTIKDSGDMKLIYIKNVSELKRLFTSKDPDVICLKRESDSEAE